MPSAKYRFLDLLPIPVLLVLAVLAVALGTPNLLLGQEADSFAGTYRDERISVDLDPPTIAGPNTTYTGTIHLGEQKFRLKAEAHEEHLKGSFENQGDQFDFVASVVGRMLVLTTDGTTYRLKKQVANPLAHAGTKPNPLSGPRPAASAPPAPSSPAIITNAPPPVLAIAPALHLKRHSIWDDTNMIGGEALSFLVPADWQVEGGLGWRMHAAVPAYISVRVSNPARTEVLETLPALPFVWAEGGIPLFPPGSIYMGNEVAQPIEDPVVYIQKVIVPRFRAALSSPKVVATEDMPKIAEVISEAAAEPGVQKKFRAARVRFEYVEQGKTMQEDIYCVMALTYAPAVGTTFWGPDRNYSFKAEKGKLEARTRLFQTIMSSFRPSVQWFNRYVQFVQLLLESQLDTTGPVIGLTRFVGRTSPEMNEARRQSYERQQAIQDRINLQYAQFVRGLEEYRNPFEKNLVQLPSGYLSVWGHPLGDLALSDDPAFNPNTAQNRDWQKLEKSH